MKCYILSLISIASLVSCDQGDQTFSSLEEVMYYTEKTEINSFHSTEQKANWLYKLNNFKVLEHTDSTFKVDQQRVIGFRDSNNTIGISFHQIADLAKGGSFESDLTLHLNANNQPQFLIAENEDCPFCFSTWIENGNKTWTGIPDNSLDQTTKHGIQDIDIQQLLTDQSEAFYEIKFTKTLYDSLGNTKILRAKVVTSIF